MEENCEKIDLKWKQICFTKHMHQLCWLLVEYNNQLEQKGLKRTHIWNLGVTKQRPWGNAVWEAVCGHSIESLYKQIKLLSGFLCVYVLDMKRRMKILIHHSVFLCKFTAVTVCFISILDLVPVLFGKPCYWRSNDLLVWWLNQRQ